MLTSLRPIPHIEGKKGENQDQFDNIICNLSQKQLQLLY